MSWLVRIYRHDGSDSTVAAGLFWWQAQIVAEQLNKDTQSDQYRAEEYNTTKAAQFFKVTDGGLKRVRKG